MAMDCARLRRRTLENSLTACELMVSKQASWEDRGKTNVFVSELIDGTVDRAVGAPSNLLLNYILVDSMMSPAIYFVIREFDARVQRFLLSLSISLIAFAHH